MKKSKKQWKIDKLVTTLIFGWTIAWVYWLSKTKKWKKVKSFLKTKTKKELSHIKKATVWTKIWKWFWKSLIFVVSIFSKKK